MTKSLLWFRNDLRLHDNEALLLASKFDEMVPVYCFDPRQYAKTSFGFPKTGSHRTRFLLESIRCLRQYLREKGSDLVVLSGKPENILPEIIDKHRIDAVFAHKEATREEIDVEEAISSALGINIHFLWGSTLYHKDDIPYEAGGIPKVFTNFRKQVEKKSSIRKEIPAPEELPSFTGIESGRVPSFEELGVTPPEADSRAVLPFKGGEKEALWRLNDYFWEQDRLKNYKFTRNRLLGADYSSKFSPWLANGSLSPRRIYREVKKYEEERKKNVSTYWMIFELIWRDFFRFSALKYGDKIFAAGGIQDKERAWSSDTDRFKKWADAKTGIPFIDANMQELNRTGFMSNRGRQNVASFLAQNLNIDWRMGAEYFESQLIDYDVCSNYGNWMYNATVGQDPRNRYFNIVNQANKYDADGAYVKHWLPELEEIPGEFVHEPHKLSEEQQQSLGIRIGTDYPAPMLDLETSYKEIRNRN